MLSYSICRQRFITHKNNTKTGALQNAMRPFSCLIKCYVFIKGQRFAQNAFSRGEGGPRSGGRGMRAIIQFICYVSDLFGIIDTKHKRSSRSVWFCWQEDSCPHSSSVTMIGSDEPIIATASPREKPFPMSRQPCRTMKLTNCATPPFLCVITA